MTQGLSDMLHNGLRPYPTGHVTLRGVALSGEWFVSSIVMHTYICVNVVYRVH